MCQSHGFPRLTQSFQLDIHKSSNFKGYTPLLGESRSAEGLGDLHEGFDIGWELETEPDQRDNGAVPREDGVMTGANVWPDKDALPGFREGFLAY